RLALEDSQHTGMSLWKSTGNLAGSSQLRGFERIDRKMIEWRAGESADRHRGNGTGDKGPGEALIPVYAG
ncbi:hypothetical protein D0N87_29385, partial [Pseudomonas sp. ATCC 13867]